MQFPLSGLLGTSTRWRVRPAGRTNQKGAAFAAPSEVTDFPDYESKRRADCGSEFA